MGNMKIQVNHCSHSIKLILPLIKRVVYRSFHCSLLPSKVMEELKDDQV